MNKIFLVGNVVKDCIIQTVGEKKTPKASFTLACNERISKDNEICNFVPCVMWGNMAVALQPHLLKGTKIAINGRLDIKNVESEEYEDEWKTFVNVNVQELDFCVGSKPSTNSEQKPAKEEKKKRR